MARKREKGDRYPSGKLKPRDIGPTREMIERRKEITGDMSMGIDHPLDVLHGKGLLSRQNEDAAEAARRRDAGAMFANLSYHIWGQPFASIDGRTRRMIPPTVNGEDADAMLEARARQTDTRTPDERAEDVRARYTAMVTMIGPGSIREWVLKQVAVYCRPLHELARNPSKRESLRRALIDALDMIGDERALRKAVDGVRGGWERRAA